MPLSIFFFLCGNQLWSVVEMMLNLYVVWNKMSDEEMFNILEKIYHKLDEKRSSGGGHNVSPSMLTGTPPLKLETDPDAKIMLHKIVNNT